MTDYIVRIGDIAGPFTFDPKLKKFREIVKMPDDYPEHLIRRVTYEPGNNQLLAAPLQIVLYVAMSGKENCGISCNFCYVPDRKYGKISDEVIEKTLEYMDKNGVARLQILGGEPLHPSLVERTMTVIRRAGERTLIREINFTTNGLFIKGVDFDLLRKNDVFVNVSIHGDEVFHEQEVQGKVFDVVWQNAVKFSQEMPISIATVVTQRNIESLPSLKKKIDTLPNLVSWGLLYPNLSEEEQTAPSLPDFWRMWEQLKSDHDNRYIINANGPFKYKYTDAELPDTDFQKAIATCSTMNNRQIEVLPNGDIYHCGMLFDFPDYHLGNILTGFKLENKFPSQKLIPEVCATHCKYYDICNGCPAWVAKNKPAMDHRCPYQL